MSELMNESENLKPRSIVSFKDYVFSIPDYQRGYRWTSVEVVKLLQDLDEYLSLGKDDEKPPFYSMQPLVVFYKEQEKIYEVLDGQQRLTTLYLLLKYLHLNNYTIKYDTRPESMEYLYHIGENKDEDLKLKKKNIDNYHIWEAYNTIESFFKKENTEELDDKKIARFSKKILNIEESKDDPDLKFIWYDISPEVKEHINDDLKRKEKIFSRLNVGKIGLTNAELLKALLLNRIAKENQFHPLKKGIINEDMRTLLNQQLSTPLKIRIASEWDMVEHSFHNPEFWAFIYGKDDDKYETRIEFIFDNIVESELSEEERVKKNEDKAYTFDFFNKELKIFDSDIKNKMNEERKDFLTAYKECKEHTIENLWQKVMETFHRYQNWYSDRVLYHLVGYLRYLGISVSEIDSLRQDVKVKTNEDFIKKLKEKINQSVLQIWVEDKKEWEDISISDLHYKDDRTRPILVLFNVLSVMNFDKSDLKFSFNDFYEQNYDIEHIRSQTPKDVKQGDEREDWIITNLEYFSGLQSEIHEIPELKDSKKKHKEKVKEYFEKLDENYLETLNQEVCTIKDENNNDKVLYAKDICRSLINLHGKNNSNKPLPEEDIYKLLCTTVFNESEFDEGEKDRIYNLALLDSNTNRGYKNAFFPVKRHWIIEREKHGFYVPPCTKNAFMKSYTKKLSDFMNWTRIDANEYLEIIEEVIDTCRI